MEQNKRSQYLQEYLRYKENMRFLNYDPEQAQWTLEKIKGFSGIKFIELLKGQQEVITWLDNIVSAIQEGAEDWENECNTLQAKCDRYEKALKEARTWVVEMLQSEHPATVKCAQDDLKLIDEALNGEGGETICDCTPAFKAAHGECYKCPGKNQKEDKQ